MLIAKEKEKGLFEKKPQEAAGDNSGPLKQTILLWIRVQFQVKGNFEISRYQVKKIRK